VQEAVRALLAAKAPVIHAGQGTLYAEATGELQELAELLSAPVMTTLVAKSAFPEDHKLSLGSGGGSWPDAAHRFFADADVILGVGTSLTDNSYSMPVPTKDKTIVQLSVDERDFNKDRRADVLLMGDAKLVLRQIIDKLKGKTTQNGQRIELLSSIREGWEKEWAPKLASDETPINPYRVISELFNGLDPKKTMITHDAGKPRDQTSPMWKSTAPRGYIGWGKSTPLGYGLGLIMGAKLADPSRFAVNIMGDAAIGMSGMDIETAVRLKIPIMTVVFNNGLMTAFETRYPVAVEKYGFKYLTGNYAMVAEGLGATGICVDRPGDLRGAIERGKKIVDGGGVVLLDVRTKEENATSNHR
jgi:thiamine pyrophosphate-dependent acetolactate synthase large subunit-like protein